ncbi:GNAT family N-acetyltransferase [Nostoc sp. 'Peltigera membranacea cyanobiont' 210A]|uniref:GNAT family N-acetyltransferase n=1 Tax=Nostoc sp. 'Peltigera membranacea cyanobiont' 210A TaxID=2014529 RepID=UPI000B95C113|nr:GNAT family N-acetyltransferase [Nostoc sp. 'Peltigera membranacea cyanobiont' 210A]OYD91969.1 GNAT family N-acetyltransferase [Nostoc sp. 'Peltigera membranacea cyanobiont' 210A]
MKIRIYEIADTKEIMKLFYDTIHEVNIHDYTEEQVAAWAPANMDIEVWIKSLGSKFTYVAEEDKIIGFGELEANGHIDRFYCHKDFQRKGVGKKILEQIELKANSLRMEKLFTEASITAKPFFESQGFIVIKKQEVERRGQKLINFVMEKHFKNC